MSRTFEKGSPGGLPALLVAALLWLLPGAARAALPGIASDLHAPTFHLVAAPGVISTSDGDSMFMWLYGETAGTVQYPGPTLIVNQGARVTIELANDLPVATSLVVQGHPVTAKASGNPAGSQIGLLTREVLPSAGGTTVKYTFDATRPGTYLYHSGTRPDLQVEMGLAGTLVVRPTATGLCPAPSCAAIPDRAYGDPATAYDREYLFFLTDSDPVIHEQVALASPVDAALGFPGLDMSERRAVDWFMNGRSFPDTLSGANVPWLPAQPYDASPQMHPGERVLMRIVGAGLDLHPLHTHGQNHLVIARDGRILGTNVLSSATPAPDLAVSDYTTTSVPGETVDALWGPWTGARLGWDVYGTQDVYPHACNDDGSGFDPVSHEYCPDHDKPFPITLPPESYLAFGPYYGGTPYLGTGADLPPLNPDGTVHVQQNPQAGLAFMWHSHSERELTTNDTFIGGMATMALVVPMGVPIPAPAGP